MTIVLIKEKLHGYIESADEKKLKAIYTLIENEIENTGYRYDEKTLGMLEERVSKYQKGEIKAYPVKESMKRIKKAVKANGL